ncbi:MAG: DUF4421 family protein [Bacteroidota bacterium]
MKQGVRLFSAIIILVLICQSGYAQFFDEDRTPKYDTNYIKVYRDELTTRVFLARKQNGLNLSERLFNPGLKYRTNDNLQLGLGYTYSFLNINLAFKLPFINADDDIYGESRYTDLSVQTNFRSLMFDLYLQWNRGYYMANPEDFSLVRLTDISKPQRGDMRTSLVGFNVHYLFNSERFSYKASFLQNEFQKRSAGTPIAGAEAYWMLSLADSSISPILADGSTYFSEGAFNQADLYNFGFNGGYAYTFVWNERIYVSVTSTVGLSGGYHVIHNTEDSYTCCQGFSAGITNNTKLSIGYNNNRYYVGISYVRFSMSQLVGSNAEWMSYTNGYIRFNVVKRFNLKRTIKFLRPDLWIY